VGIKLMFCIDYFFFSFVCRLFLLLIVSLRLSHRLFLEQCTAFVLYPLFLP